MPAQAIWASEAPGDNHPAPLEIENARPQLSRSTATDSPATDYPALSVTASLSSAYSKSCVSWPRPMRQC
jgi:hypothetical protein